jgi:hypothetical protein
MTTQQAELDAELAALKGEQFGKSQAAQQAIADEMKSNKDNAMYNLLRDIGVGTAKGTSQFALSNLGGGAEYAAEQQQRRALQEDANRKLMLQQQVEQEKAEFARRAQLAGMKQSSITNLMNKELGLQQIKATGEAAAGARADANFIRAEKSYRDAINDRIKSLITNEKNALLFQNNPRAIEMQAEDYVKRNTSPRTLEMLGIKPPKAEAPKALPLPAGADKNPALLKKNAVYNVPGLGELTWDGKQFVSK